MTSGTASHPFGLSQIPGDPSFRNSAVNAVAVIPLLSTDNEGNVTASKSADSFRHLLTALKRLTKHADSSDDELLLVIPNSSLTRPGDWRYSDTPLKAFHWQHGCQRVKLFDGRPDCSRQAHDRLMNHGMTRDWIDLCPSRRTAAVIGVLNMHDCRNTKDLELAEEELRKWTERYATPPYEVTAHGRNVARDQPVMRLFVYDSFDEACQTIDLTKQSSMGNSVLAFPPIDDAHAQMMDLHLNVVVNDLAVAIFLDLETKIRESDAICSSNSMQVAASANASSSAARRSLTRIISGGSSDGKEGEQEPAQSGKTLTLSSIAGLVSPDSKLAQDSPRENTNKDTDEAEREAKDERSTAATSESDEKTKKSPQKRPSDAGDKPPLKPTSASTPLLLTPLDDYWEPAELSARDIDAIRKRDLGRREKYAADLSLLAGSPLDAYERYLKAAELCKSGTLDPLWYASSLEGCASSHIAMTESGGYSIDDYLDNNFQLPDELMALVKKSSEDNKRQVSSNKQTLPDVVFALCEEALNIVNRHPKLAAYHAELLLKLAWYAADTATMHLRCRWGEGPSCYHGEPSDPPRWEKTSVYNLQFEGFKGDDPVVAESVERAKKICDYLHQATSLRSLDSATRVDVASHAIVLCIQGVKPMEWGKASREPIVLPRKAAFFAAVAADAVNNDSAKNAGKLWLLATQLYSRNGGPTYGWGALRASCLGALSTRGNNVLSLEASEQLLSLLCELNPSMNVPKEPVEEKEDAPAQAESAERGISELSGHGSSAAPKGEQEGISSTANLFAKQLREGYHQIKATSTFLAQQSKWAYEDPLPPHVLPLGDTSTIGSSLLNLKCVWTTSDLHRCAAAQSQCVNRISVLRRSLPTPSSQDFVRIYGRGTASITVPLYVVSAKAIDADSQLEVQKINPALPKADHGAMATFFNPFEEKRKAGGLKGVTSVAEGEERAFSVKFGNRLAVPLEITRCQLEFRGRETSRVKATSLSFTVPPKSRAFTISFPFTVLPRSVASDDNFGQGEDFEVSGVDLTWLGRSFGLPMKPVEENLGFTSFPIPGSVYTRKSDKKKEPESAPASFPIQVYPCQPSLHVFFADSHTPFEGLTVNLADGELYTSPPLLLECYAGPSGHGTIEQLEIYVSGLTSTNQKLFDTSSAVVPQANDDFVRETFDKESSQPLKIRVVAEKFSLSSVNGRQGQKGDSDNRLQIQVVTSHSMASRLEKDTQLRLRFRYRGQTNKSAQVWRNNEIPLKIKLSKGPRITCLSFQPDIHSDCFFRELAKTLDLKGDGSSEQAHMDKKERAPEICQTQHVKVGLHTSANVCSGEVGVLATVLNETRSEVKLSRASGAISNLGNQQFEEVIVRPSVSVKIPMLLQRHKLTDQTVVVNDLVDQLVSSTKFEWRSPDASGGEAFGHVRVHPDCLRQLVAEHPSILSKVCDPPCSVAVLVNGASPVQSHMTCSLGSPGAEVSVKVDVADWVSFEERKKCDVKMELICAREKEVVEPSVRDHVWAGRLRHRVSMAESCLEHRARVIFCSPGNYIVSACVRITHEVANKGVEEIWFAPFAQRILVKRADVPSQ